MLCTIDRIVDRLVARLRATRPRPAPAAERLRAMLLDRVLFRFDSVRDYSHGLDELFASLRPAYLARRQAYFEAEAAVFADVLRGRARGRRVRLPRTRRPPPRRSCSPPTACSPTP